MAGGKGGLRLAEKNKHMRREKGRHRTVDASLNIDTSTLPVKDWWRMESNASSNHCAALNTVTTTDYREGRKI